MHGLTRRDPLSLLARQVRSLAALCVLLAWLLLAFVSTRAAATSAAEDPPPMGMYTNPPLTGGPVNLSTGDAEFSLPLAAISGRKGLSYALAARYSSNVLGPAKAWNGESPTGPMGLGWTLDYPKVTVDWHGAADYGTNDYYLEMNGQRSRLIPAGSDGQGNTLYTTDTFARWRISFTSSPRLRWTMIDENGTVYVFGDVEVAATQHSIQWAVIVGQPTDNGRLFAPSRSPGSLMVPAVFNLARITEPWGNSSDPAKDNSLYFHYLANERVFAEQGAAVYTQESYLQKIANSFGDSIQLTYANKVNDTVNAEYVAPHGDSAAFYQDRYETKYLSTVSSYKNNSASPDNVVTLGYTLFNAYPDGAHATYAKRTLISAQTANGAGRSAAPATRFTYHTTPSDPHFGALMSVTHPSGGETKYTYAMVTPELSALDHTIQRPEGFDRPRVWIGEGYAVVLWANSATNATEFQVYSWEGRWIKGATIAATDTADWTQVRVRTGLQTIAIMRPVAGPGCGEGGCPVLHTLHKSKGKTGQWEAWQYALNDTKYQFVNASGQMPPYAAFDVGAGTDLASVTGFQLAATGTVAVRNLLVYTSSGFQALTSQQAYLGNLSTSSLRSQTRVRDKTVVTRFAAPGATDLFELVRSSTAGGFLHHFAWSSVGRASGADFALGDGFGVVREACPSGAAVVFNTVPDVVSNFNPSNTRSLPVSPTSCSSPVGISDNTIGIGSAFFQVNDKGLQFVAKPGVGQKLPMDVYAPEFAATVDDCCTDWLLKPWVYRARFGDWAQVAPSITVSGLETSGQRFMIYDPSSPGSLAIAWRLNNDSWQASLLPSGNRGVTARAGKKGLVAYDESLDYVGSNPLDTVTNFALPGGFRLAGGDGDFDKGTKLAGDLTAVAVNAFMLDSADTLKLFRARDQKPYAFSGTQSVAVVSKIVSTTGYEDVPNAGLPSKTTQYDFDPAKATMDPSGRYARFNHVTVRNGAGSPGSTNPNDPHYGYSEVWLYNSLEPSALPNNLQPHPGNEGVTYALLVGQPYYGRTVREVFQNGRWTTGSVTAYSFTSYQTTIKDSSTSGHVGGLAAYTRVKATSGTRDNAGGAVDIQHTYLDASAGELEGLLSQSTMYSMNVNGQWELDVTDYTYAAKVYPTWNSAVHWISALAGVKVTRQDTSQVLSNTATTYQPWGTAADGSVLWGPLSVYRWQRGASSATFNYASPNADWLQGPQVDTVNSAGLVTQSKYTYGNPAVTVYSATLYDTRNRMAVAGFSDAQLVGGGATADFWGMEDYESGAGWTAPSGTRVGGSVNTGKKAMSLTGNLYRSNALNIPTSAGRTYVLSAWVNAPAGVTVTLQLKGWMNGQNTVSTQRAFTPSGSQADTWQYVEVYLNDTNIAGVGPWINVSGGTARVDDVRVGPSEAPFSASVYDLDKGIVTASLGQNGEVMRSLVDEFRRPAATVGPADAVTGMGLGYYSRAGNGDSFNPTDPNSAVAFAGAAAGTYADFANADPATGKWQCTSGTCTPTPSGLSTNGTVQMTAQPDFEATIRAQIDYSSTGPGPSSYKVQLGSGNIKTGACSGPKAAAAALVGGYWRLYSCTNGSFINTASVPETRPANQIPRDWVFYVTRDRRTLFVGGKRMLEDTVQWPVAQTNTYPVSVGSDNGTQMTLSNIAVLAAPSMGGSFLDGAGRALQSVAVNTGNTVTASGNLYDANWVRTVRTKNLHYTSTFSYNPGLVQRDASGNVSGQIVTAYGSSADTAAGYTNDGGYPYDGLKEYTEPQARTNLSGAPGTDYNPASSTGHPANFAYGTNSSGPAFQTSARSPFQTGSLLVNTGTQPVSKDASGTLQSLTTQALTTVPGAGIAGMVQGASGYGYSGTLNLQTLRTLDAMDRTNTFYHARYFAPSGTEPAPNSFLSKLGYDNYDRAITAVLPNSGATQIVYDKAGQLRFWMDAAGAQASPNNISYRKYDRIGRVIEEGYLDTMNFDRAALEQMAEDASQPATPALTWRRKYQYGVPPEAGTPQGQSPSLYVNGRMRVVQSNNGTASDAQELHYDARGRIAAVIEKTHPYLDGLVTKYAHDNLGRVTTVFNPAQLASETANGTTYTYNVLGQVTAVGRNLDGVVDDDYYAAYEYGPNGEILDELRNTQVPPNHSIALDATIKLSYAYNSPGLLKSITAKTGSHTRYSEALAYSDSPAGHQTYDGRIGSSTQSFAPKSTDPQKTLSHLYSYYPEGGLKSAAASGSFTAGTMGAQAFSYSVMSKDANQNLLMAQQGTGPVYHYNVKSTSDQLTSVTLDGTVNVKSSYTYDANGNVVSKSGQINNVKYDPFYNKAQSILPAQSQMQGMRYGGLGGERVWQTYFDKSTGSTMENTYFRALGALPLVIRQDKLASQVRTPLSRKTMVWGPTGLIAVNEFFYGSRLSMDHFVVPDHRGSTVMSFLKGQFDASVHTYAYTPSGNIVQGDGTPVTSAPPVPYLFQAREYDWQTGLHHHGSRFYDSDMMMYLAPDPVFRVGESPYVAMGNDPVNN